MHLISHQKTLFVNIYSLFLLIILFRLLWNIWSRCRKVLLWCLKCQANMDVKSQLALNCLIFDRPVTNCKPQICYSNDSLSVMVINSRNKCKMFWWKIDRFYLLRVKILLFKINQRRKSTMWFKKGSIIEKIWMLIHIQRWHFTLWRAAKQLV